MTQENISCSEKVVKGHEDPMETAALSYSLPAEANFSTFWACFPVK